MQIPAFGNASVYATHRSSNAGGSTPTQSHAREQAGGTRLSLSAEIRVTGRIAQEVEKRGGQAGEVPRDALGIPMHMRTLDPAVPLAAAEEELQTLMEKEGIPSDPQFSFTVSDTGGISVEPPDHPNKDALEDMANSSKELRNNLVSASNLSHLQAIGRAAYQAHQAADGASPEQVEHIYNRLFQYVDKVSGYDYVASFENGKLSSGFQDASGKAISLPEFRI